MKILAILLITASLSACSRNVHKYEESPCACFEYEIFGGEKYKITENS